MSKDYWSSKYNLVTVKGVNIYADSYAKELAKERESKELQKKRKKKLIEESFSSVFLEEYLIFSDHNKKYTPIKSFTDYIENSESKKSEIKE